MLKRFWDQVLATATICKQHLANKILMKRLTLQQWRKYNNATNCSIYPNPFRSLVEKVRHQDHLMGEYRGPAHNTCNLNYCINSKKLKIPCIIHTLKGILFLCYSYFYIFMIFLFLILVTIYFIL